jgi:hypothetical protein
MRRPDIEKGPHCPTGHLDANGNGSQFVHLLYAVHRTVPPL